MIVIGSYAAHLNGATLRPRFKDLDLVGAPEDVARFRAENRELIAAESQAFGHRVRFELKPGAPFGTVEIDTEQAPSDRLLAGLCAGQAKVLNSTVLLPTLEALYLTKRAHANVATTYDKTIVDLKALRPRIGAFSAEQLAYYKARKAECQERYATKRQRFVLSIPNEEFFATSNHIRAYEHDDLHKAIAYTPGQPMYERCKKDLSLAKIDTGMFKAMPPADQLIMVREEFMVIGLERYYLADRSLSNAAVYGRGMHKTIRDLFVGFFQDYCIDHIVELSDPPPYDFIGRFETALRQGRIRPVKITLPPVTAEHRKAMALIREGRMDEARRIAEDLAKASGLGGDPHAYGLLGLVFARQKNLPLAEKCFRKCLSRDRQNREIWFQLGLACHRQGRRKDAIAAYRKALENGLDSFGVHANLGQALEAEGQARQAQAAYAKALAKNPDPEIARRMDALTPPQEA